MDFTALLGQTLDGKYQLEALIGKGGMGGVFRAVHLGTSRTVALKVIAPDLMAHGDYLERFKREARAAGGLRHPNIVDLTDFGIAEAEGRPIAYLVMEHLQGWTLAEVLRTEKHLPLPFVVEVMDQVCAALAFAHGQGLVHRDIKPENIWLEPDSRGSFQAKVLDFGLAKVSRSRTEGPSAKEGAAFETRPIDPEATVRTPTPMRAAGDPNLTELGTILGTPAYMSPEQCRGVEVDARSDLYSLGVVLHEVLAGSPPFAGTTGELINAHIQARPPDVLTLRRDLYEGIGLLVASTLAKDPADRPPTARMFIELLHTYSEAGWGGILKAMHLVLSQPSRFVLPTWLHLLPSCLLLAPLTLGLLGREPWTGRLPWVMTAWFFAVFAALSVNAVSMAAVTERVRARPLALHSLRTAWERPWAMVQSLIFRLKGLLPILLIALGIVLRRALPGMPFWLPLVLGGMGIAFGLHFFRRSSAFPLVAPILAIEGCASDRALARGTELLRPLDLRHQRNKLLQSAVPILMYTLVTGLLLVPVVYYPHLDAGGSASSYFALIAGLVVVLLGLILPATQTAMALRYFQLVRLTEGDDSAPTPFGERAILHGQSADDLHRIISGRSSGKEP